MEIRLAVISELAGQRRIIAEKLSLLGEFQTVYQGESLSTNFDHLRKASPDVIIVSAVNPGTFQRDVNESSCRKIANLLPDTKLLLLTDLQQDHTYVKEAIRCGLNIIHDHSDWSAVANGIEMIMDGKHLIRYESDAREIETYRYRKTHER
jgi:DNA-binding NarL/FixJ family response regulator